jgi:flavin-dependent dehydrogenase
MLSRTVLLAGVSRGTAAIDLWRTAMYDAIVIGARCAGAPTAMLLARRGHRVLLVDRATFPSDIPHGHLIHRHGPRYLREWGLLDRVAAVCPPIRSVTMDLGDFPLTGVDLEVDGVALAYAPRRNVLDAILVEAAAAAGVEVRAGFTVDDVVADGDRIAGIRGRDMRGGAAVTERAHITIGADGRNSRLARAVAAPVYEAVPTLSCYYFSYWSDAPVTGLEIYALPQRVIFAFPTGDGLVGVFVTWPAAELPMVRADIEAQFMAVIDQAPALAAALRQGRRVERFAGAADLPNFFRVPGGPGWALVGDAGHHKDPFLALGIADAFRDAALLADAVDTGLAGRVPMVAALADYERRRNEASMDDYRQNLHLAAFKPFPPEFMRLRAAVRGHQADTNHLFLARQGMVPPETFFNPANLQRLMGRAAAAD